MSNTTPFAERVVLAMKERGVTLRQLCRDVGLDASFFSKVLSGKRSPPVEEEVLRRIAERLALEPAELVVAAGRIPEEWQPLWRDAQLFADVHRLASAGRAPAASVRSPAALRPKPKPQPAVSAPEPIRSPADLGTELL